MITHDKIIKQVSELLAQGSAETVSIRKLAEQVNIAPSVIYHYFPTKYDLLKKVFDHNNQTLGKKRAKLPKVDTAYELLRQRIEFQFDNAALIVGVLNFYLSYRSKFPQHTDGFLPDKTYLHIQEVIEFGIKTGELLNKDIEKQARVAVHAINGYLLEYFPHIPTGATRKKVIEELHSFIWRSFLKQ